jgi:MraZ protein
MFLGEYTHTIDDKGRLTIPAKFRGELALGLVVTRGYDQNLMIYPLDEWQEMAESVLKRPLGDEEVRTFRRRIFSGAVDLTPDRQGRIVVPTYLREFAAIDGEVIVAGMYNYIEVWASDNWQNEKQTIENSGDTARWSDLGI